jgi:hypothetical protein
MKLMTDMVDHGAAQHFALEHDAACAHALMQALADANEAMGRDVAWWIKTRADAILKLWGFGSTPEQPE